MDALKPAIVISPANGPHITVWLARAQSVALLADIEATGAVAAVFSEPYHVKARLILLRRRMNEQASGLELQKSGRGQLRLVVSRPLKLLEVNSG